MRISDWSSDVCSSDLDVAVGVVDDLLAHGDGEGLGEAAVHLALDDHRIDPRAAVVQRVEAAHLGDAGVGIYVDHADVRAERIGHVRSEEHTSELQSLMRISYSVFCLK